jgi:hypothetical protein
MKRGDFLKCATAPATFSVLGAPDIRTAAKAQGRQETLLFVTEAAPNNFDTHGVEPLLLVQKPGSTSRCRRLCSTCSRS